MGVVTAAVVAAGVTAYAANKSANATNNAAKAASGPSSQTTHNTSTTTSGSAGVQDALNQALQGANQLYQQGPILRKGGSNSGVDAQTRNIGQQIINMGQQANPTLGSANEYLNRVISQDPTASQAAAAYHAPTASDLPPNLQAQVASGKLSLSDAVNRAMTTRPDFAAKFTPPPPSAAGGAGGGSNAGSQALDYNPVLQDLYGRLGGASLDQSSDLLSQFYQQGGGGTGETAAPAQAPMGSTYAAGYINSSGQIVRPSSAGGAAGVIGDSTAGPGLFNQYAQDELSGKYLDPNNPQLQAYLDVINRRGQQALQQQLDTVGDQADAVGMYGSSGQALQSSRTQAAGLQNIDDSLATATYQAYGDERNRMQDTAGLVNTRDVDAAQIQAQAAEGAANRGASSSEAAADRALDLQLQTRGQNLSALQSLQQNNQFGLGLLGNLGTQLSSDRTSAIGQAPGIDDAQYGGLQKALGVSQAFGQADAQAKARNAAIQWQNQNAQGVNLDSYMRRLGALGSTVQTTTNDGQLDSSGHPVGNVVDPTGASIAGGLGAGLSAWALLSQNNGGQSAPPAGTVYDPTGVWGAH